MARVKFTGTLKLCAAAAALAAASAAVIAVRPRGPGLPPYARHPALPASFDAALVAAYGRASSRGADSVRELAALYLANGLYDEASACYRVAPLSRSLSARDHYYLAMIAQAKSDLEGAKSELQATIRLDPRVLAPRLELADCLYKTGDPDGAGAAYRAVLAAQPDQPQAMFGLARVELQDGDDNAAAAELGRLMGAHPENASGAGLYAEILGRRGDKAGEARMTLLSRQKPEEAVPNPWVDDLYPRCYDIQRLSLKFEEYFNSGAIERAEPLMQRVGEVDPSNPIPQFVEGWSLARSHRDAEAVEEYKRALDKGGDPERICPFMAQSLLALGRTREAAALLASAYAKRPDSVSLLMVYADVAGKAGETAAARPLLEKLLQRQPDLRSANMSLARILWSSGERDAAARRLQRVADGYPADVPSRALLGEYFVGKGQAALAVPPLEEALRSPDLRPDAAAQVTASLYRAYLAAARDSDPSGTRAAGWADKAERLEPGVPDAYAAKAAICAAAGQLDEAAQALGGLAALQPSNPTVFLSWGDVAYKKGDAALAAQKWRLALSLTPEGDSRLREALRSRLDGAGDSP
ncbi:MAG TPA: tetratricopeptide repeat protein [Opitutaceae bacterium]